MERNKRHVEESSIPLIAPSWTSFTSLNSALDGFIRNRFPIGTLPHYGGTGFILVPKSEPDGDTIASNIACDSISIDGDDDTHYVYSAKKYFKNSRLLFNHGSCSMPVHVSTRSEPFARSGEVNQEMLQYNANQNVVMVADSSSVSCFKWSPLNALNERLEPLDKLVNSFHGIIELAPNSDHSKFIVNCGQSISSLTLTDEFKLEFTNHDSLSQSICGSGQSSSVDSKKKSSSIGIKKMCLNQCEGLSHEGLVITNDRSDCYEGKGSISLIDMSREAIVSSDLCFNCCRTNCNHGSLSCLYMTRNHPRIVYVNDSHSMALIDLRIRKKSKCVQLFQSGEKNGHLLAFDSILASCAYSGHERQHLVLSDHQVNLVDERFPRISVINLSHCLETDERNRVTTLKSFEVNLTSGGHDAVHLVAVGNKDTVTMSTLKGGPFGHILTPESLHSPVQMLNLSDCFHHYLTASGDASYLLESRIKKSTLTGLQIIPSFSGSFSLIGSTNYADVFLQDILPKEAKDKFESWSYGHHGNKVLDTLSLEHLKRIICDLKPELKERVDEYGEQLYLKNGKLRFGLKQELTRKGLDRKEVHKLALNDDESILESKSCSCCQSPAFPTHGSGTGKSASKFNAVESNQELSPKEDQPKSSPSSTFLRKFETLFGPSDELFKNRSLSTVSENSPHPGHSTSTDSKHPPSLPVWNELTYKLIQAWNDQSVLERIPVEAKQSLNNDDDHTQREGS